MWLYEMLSSEKKSSFAFSLCLHGVLCSIEKSSLVISFPHWKHLFWFVLHIKSNSKSFTSLFCAVPKLIPSCDLYTSSLMTKYLNKCLVCRVGVEPTESQWQGIYSPHRYHLRDNDTFYYSIQAKDLHLTNRWAIASLLNLAVSQGFEPCAIRLTGDRTYLMCFLTMFSITRPYLFNFSAKNLINIAVNGLL